MAARELLAEDSLSAKLIKKGFWLYLFTYLAAPAGYLTRVIISNSLSVADVGVIYSIVSFVSFISIYNDFGLTESLQYFVPKYWLQKKVNYIKTAIVGSLTIQLSTALLIIGILWFGADWLADNYFHHPSAVLIIKFFCIYFLGKNAYEVIATVFLSFQDVFNQKLIDFVRVWSTTIFTAFFFLQGMGTSINYAIAWIVGLFLGLLLGIYLFRTHYKELLVNGNVVKEKEMYQPYIRYALWIFIGANASNLLGQVDQQMIIVLLGATDAGFYANYLSLLGISSIFVGPILGIMLPIFTELRTRNQTDKLSELLNFMYTYISIFALSFAGILIALGPLLAAVLFGQKFMFAGTLLYVGGVILVFDILVGVSFSMLGALEKVKERVVIIATIGLLNIVLNYIFMKIWGLYGVVISTLVGTLGMLLRSTFLLRKEQTITFQWGLIFRNIGCIVLLSGLVFILKDYFYKAGDSFRIYNGLWIIAVGISYYCLFGLYNRKKIVRLKSEIVALRKGNNT